MTVKPTPRAVRAQNHRQQNAPSHLPLQETLPPSASSLPSSQYQATSLNTQGKRSERAVARFYAVITERGFPLPKPSTVISVRSETFRISLKGIQDLKDHLGSLGYPGSPWIRIYRVIQRYVGLSRATMVESGHL